MSNNRRDFWLFVAWLVALAALLLTLFLVGCQAVQQKQSPPDPDGPGSTTRPALEQVQPVQQAGGVNTAAQVGLSVTSAIPWTLSGLMALVFGFTARSNRCALEKMVTLTSNALGWGHEREIARINADLEWRRIRASRPPDPEH